MTDPGYNQTDARFSSPREDWQPSPHFWALAYAECQSDGEKRLAKFVVEDALDQFRADSWVLSDIIANLAARRQDEQYRLDSVPMMYRGGWLTLKTLSPVIAAKIQTLQGWLAAYVNGDNVCGWYVWGSVGTGKTALLRGLQVTMLESGHWRASVFIESVEFQGLLNKCFSMRPDEDGPRVHEIVERYTAAPILVVDDWGGVKLAEATRRTMYDILNRRSKNEKPVLMTSNRPWKEVADAATAAGNRDGDPQLWGRLSDRLREMLRPMEVNGPSLRGRKGEDDD